MSIVTPFLIGSIIGAALGGQFIVALPKYFLQLVIAVFILVSTWAPKFQSTSTGKVKFYCGVSRRLCHVRRRHRCAVGVAASAVGDITASTHLRYDPARSQNCHLLPCSGLLWPFILWSAGLV
jgi:uncharacterized membrane protein YfcA